MLTLSAVAMTMTMACDGAVPDDYCDPCVGEVPVECEDVCAPDPE